MRGCFTLIVLGLASTMLSAQQRFLDKSPDAWASELSHSDAKIRRNAAFALGKLGSTAFSTVPKLKKALQEDSDARVRDAAAWAVGEIAKENLKIGADTELIKTLANVLRNDKEPMVRRSAAFALGCFGADALSAKEALESALDSSRNPPAVRQNVAWALGQLGAPALATLRTAMKDNDALVLRDAAVSLGTLPLESAREALPELLACLSSEHGEARRASLGVLVKLVGPEDKTALAPLQKALSDSDVDARRNAALALGNIGGAEAAPAVPVLLDAIRRGDRELRKLATQVIKNIGPEAFAAVPELTRVLTDPDDEQLRANAALALGGIGAAAESAVPHLVRRVTDAKENTIVRMEAATALSRIGPVAEAVKAVPDLTSTIGDPQTPLKAREKILWALRIHYPNLGDLKVLPTLLKILAEPKTGDNYMLRYDCAYVLGVSDGPSIAKEAMDVLLEFLKDERILIYDTTAVKSGGVGEAGIGVGKREDLGKGDGRVMAIQALEVVGAERVIGRPDIVAQLRVIANDKKAFPKLRDDAKKLLDKIGK